MPVHLPPKYLNIALFQRGVGEIVSVDRVRHVVDVKRGHHREIQSRLCAEKQDIQREFSRGFKQRAEIEGDPWDPTTHRESPSESPQCPRRTPPLFSASSCPCAKAETEIRTTRHQSTTRVFTHHSCHRLCAVVARSSLKLFSFSRSGHCPFPFGFRIMRTEPNDAHSLLTDPSKQSEVLHLSPLVRCNLPQFLLFRCTHISRS
jgi:hypothetical protein